MGFMISAPNFYLRIFFLQPRLNILIFLPIAG